MASGPSQRRRRRRVNWRVLSIGAVVTLPLVALLASGFGRDPKLRSNALEGRQAPAFSLKTLSGEPFSLASVKGKPVVLNFWSTWCQPCKIEHPVLMGAAESYGPAGVQFVAVLYQDEPAKAQAFLNRSGAHWPTLADPGGRTAIAYGVAGVPETFFIDKDGRIVRKVSGPVSQAIMVTTLEQML
jgi:cytochrome c biogenesis protein CcmG/thiol:disulfide interchange protein DsbE